MKYQATKLMLLSFVLFCGMGKVYASEMTFADFKTKAMKQSPFDGKFESEDGSFSYDFKPGTTTQGFLADLKASSISNVDKVKVLKEAITFLGTSRAFGVANPLRLNKPMEQAIIEEIRGTAASSSSSGNQPTTSSTGGSDKSAFQKMQEQLAAQLAADKAKREGGGQQSTSAAGSGASAGFDLDYVKIAKLVKIQGIARDEAGLQALTFDKIERFCEGKLASASGAEKADVLARVKTEWKKLYSAGGDTVTTGDIGAGGAARSVPSTSMSGSASIGISDALRQTMKEEAPAIAKAFKMRSVDITADDAFDQIQNMLLRKGKGLTKPTVEEKQFVVGYVAAELDALKAGQASATGGQQQQQQQQSAASAAERKKEEEQQRKREEEQRKRDEEERKKREREARNAQQGPATPRGGGQLRTPAQIAAGMVQDNPSDVFTNPTKYFRDQDEVNWSTIRPYLDQALVAQVRSLSSERPFVENALELMVKKGLPLRQQQQQQQQQQGRLSPRGRADQDDQDVVTVGRIFEVLKSIPARTVRQDMRRYDRREANKLPEMMEIIKAASANFQAADDESGYDTPQRSSRRDTTPRRDAKADAKTVVKLINFMKEAGEFLSSDDEDGDYVTPQRSPRNAATGRR